ncbi:hypothetical protein I8920_01190 [Curtobacterium sp. YC1]|uniref:hypothetical protein n=1 Tax=Curtobacterium sp. YC1 TaxID=2795488 RepID=UPI0018E51BAE|nr:hypothetical protein [Curtobacterium sp. YC1]QQD76421.1 hypothetical protein I8920_01190 [Curtobacterium sp. YC1]
MTEAQWVEFDDEPKRRVFRARFRRAVPLVLVIGTASAFLSRGGETPFQTWGWIAVPIWFAGTGLFLAALWGLVLLQTRPFAIDVGRQRVRIRGRTLAFSDVDVAELDPITNNEPDMLSLRFGRRRGRKISLLVREGREAAITGERRAALLALIAGSPITRPSSRHDPEGTFARSNFPGTLDKVGAASVVCDPPQVGEPGP